MAENTDKDVDACIADLQAALDRLKAAQKRDDDAYAEEDAAPKNLNEAGKKAYRMVRRARQDSDS